MAICTSCHQEMLQRVGCPRAELDDFGDNQRRKRIPFGSEDLGILYRQNIVLIACLLLELFIILVVILKSVLAVKVRQ